MALSPSSDVIGGTVKHDNRTVLESFHIWGRTPRDVDNSVRILVIEERVICSNTVSTALHIKHHGLKRASCLEVSTQPNGAECPSSPVRELNPPGCFPGLARW